MFDPQLCTNRAQRVFFCFRLTSLIGKRDENIKLRHRSRSLRFAQDRWKTYYTPFLRNVAQESFHYELEDLSRSNELFHLMFGTYAEKVDAETPVHPELPADRLREEFRIKYGIHILPRAVKQLGSPSWVESMHLTGQTSLLTYSLKLGTRELQSLLAVLKKLPEQMVPEINTIRREFSCTDSLQLLIGGMFTYGVYNGQRKEITLYTAEDDVHPVFAEPVTRQLYLDTLVHELSHGFFQSLLNEEQESWRKVSKVEEPVDQGSFVYDWTLQKKVYSSNLKGKDSAFHAVGLQQEDFCEHLAAYVNHGVEFRERAARNAGLQAKYQFLKELFGKHAGKGVEYADAPLASLADIETQRHQAIGQVGMDLALAILEHRIALREKRALELREEVCTSYETQAETPVEPDFEY